jgi:hypothetical protein
MIRSGSGMLSMGHEVIRSSGCSVNAAGPVPRYHDLINP